MGLMGNASILHGIYCPVRIAAQYARRVCRCMRMHIREGPGISSHVLNRYGSAADASYDRSCKLGCPAYLEARSLPLVCISEYSCLVGQTLVGPLVQGGV